LITITKDNLGTDLSVTIAGVKMTPPMGLTSWAAFKRDGKEDMVMGTWS
jgi:Domain of Unknown Function (DUF1259)